MLERQIGTTKESPITFVELPPTSGGRLDGQRAEDVYSKLRLPPRAIPLLHPIVERAGYKDVVSIAPQYNPESKLTDGDWKRIVSSDVLALSSISRTITQTEELAREYKRLNPRGLVIVGGFHASSLPEECLKWADIVVRGEGEQTLSELMTALEDNGSPKGVKGVSYKRGDEVVHEPSREGLSEEQLANLPSPIYSEAVQKGKRTNTEFTSRGCPFGCNYCLVPTFYGNYFRRKPNEVIIAQLKALPQGSTFIIDDNLAGKPRETTELLGLMKEEGLNRNSYTIQVRAQAGLIKDLPEHLSQAGIQWATVGIESLTDETLKQIGKKTTSAQNKEGVRSLRERLRVHGMFMIGLDGDTPESVRETLEWAKYNVDTAQFFAPAPLPGTEFAQQMEDQGRVLSKEYYLYDGQNVLLRPLHFSPYQLQQTIINMYKEFYSFKLFGDRVGKAFFGAFISRKTSAGQAWDHLKYDLLIRTYARWFAIRSFINDPQTQRHLTNLKAWS